MVDRQLCQTVDAGCWVKIEGFEPNEQEVFYLVDEADVNLLENKISIKSPFARALMGAKVGDEVPYQTPVGEVQLTVLEVGRS